MRASQLGNLGIAALAAINVVLWLLFPPLDDGRRLFANQVVSEVFSSTGMTLMACAIVLTLRPRFLEPFFGGLDKMYQSHKTAALTGFVLILAHFFTMPGSGEVYLGRDLGKLALIGFLVLIALTLAPRLPVVGGYVRLAYHHWRWSHKLIGAVFILGILHTFQARNVMQFAEIPAWYWKIVAYGAAGLYLYQVALTPLMASFPGRSRAFTVEAVRHLNGSTAEVTLKPRADKPAQRAGQFLFVGFPGDRVLAEPHPFTVSSAPHEPNLRLSIKAAGDWTRHLYAHLKPGAEARVDGCYGMFDFRAGGREQIWIAGGIGVTPFLSWVRSFDGETGRDIAFFYTVRSEADALFWDEFTAAAQRQPGFRAKLNVSSRDGSLTVDKIAAQVGGDLAGRHIYLCGPAAMTAAFAEQFRARGVPAARIHYEEFNFR